jgi:hypothetical protein
MAMLRIYLIHRYYNWAKDFSDQDALLEYLRANDFDRTKLHEYLIIHGEGLWHQIALELPPGGADVRSADDPSVF